MMMPMAMAAARAISHQFWLDEASCTVAAGAGPAGSSGAGAGAGSIGVPWPLAKAAVLSEAASAVAVTRETIRFRRQSS